MKQKLYILLEDRQAFAYGYSNKFIAISANKEKLLDEIFNGENRPEIIYYNPILEPDKLDFVKHDYFSENNLEAPKTMRQHLLDNGYFQYGEFELKIKEVEVDTNE